MGIYDIDKIYTSNIKPSFQDLCKEILCEYGDKTKQDEYLIARQLKNSSNNGLIDQLNKKLHYDIRANAGDDPSNQFEMYQLLKLLYAMQKKGIIPFCEKNTNNPIPIVNIFAKPRLENINSFFSKNTKHGEYVNSLISLLLKYFDTENNRCSHLDEMNHKWNCFCLDISYSCAASDDALNNPNKNLLILKSINNFLENHVIPTFNKFNEKNIPYRESVMHTFLNLLLTNYFSCYNQEMEKINNITIDEKMNDTYVNYFKKYEFKKIDLQITDKIQDYIKKNKKDDYAEVIYCLIMYTTELDSELKSQLLYALKKIKNIVPLIEKHRGVDLSQGIDITLFVAIIQEIMYVRKNNPQIHKDHLQYTTGAKSLMRYLAEPNKDNQDINSSDGIIELAWINRIQSRLMINFGLYDNAKEARKMENLVFTIREKFYSHKNLIDMMRTSDVLLSTIQSFVDANFNPFVVNVLINNLEKKLKYIYEN